MNEIIFIAVLFVAMVGCYVWLFNAEMKQQRRVEHLYGEIAKLAVNQQHIQYNHEKLMSAEETAEQRIADKIEKKWNKGLENMMSYNPFIKQDDGDEEV